MLNKRFFFIKKYGESDINGIKTQLFLYKPKFVINAAGLTGSPNIDWCDDNKVDYGVLTGFKNTNTIRTESDNALFNYHIASESYGVVECVHQVIGNPLIEFVVIM